MATGIRFTSMDRATADPDPDDGAIGALLRIGECHPDPATRSYAEATAKIAAQFGAEQARGFLRGIWYIGGVKTVESRFLPYEEGEWRPTYHDVILAIQPALGLELVRFPERD